MIRKFERALLIFSAMMPTMYAANLAAPAAVHAGSLFACAQWRFDGYTEFVHDNGSKLEFVSFTSDLGLDGLYTTIIPPGGGPAEFGWTTANIDGTVISMMFRPFYNPAPFRHVFYNGGVLPDGSAYGIMHDDLLPKSTSWRLAAPLACA